MSYSVDKWVSWPLSQFFSQSVRKPHVMRITFGLFFLSIQIIYPSILSFIPPSPTVITLCVFLTHHLPFSLDLRFRGFSLFQVSPWSSSMLNLLPSLSCFPAIFFGMRPLKEAGMYFGVAQPFVIFHDISVWVMANLSPCAFFSCSSFFLFFSFFSCLHGWSTGFLPQNTENAYTFFSLSLSFSSCFSATTSGKKEQGQGKVPNTVVDLTEVTILRLFDEAFEILGMI